MSERFEQAVRLDELPAELAAALARDADARARFEALPPSHRDEYVRWVAEAKREETRARRSAETVRRLGR